MRQWFARCALALGAAILAAPSIPALAQEDDLAFILDVLENDYAGWETKTEGDRMAAFEERVAKTRERLAANPEARMWAYGALLDWFEDDHLGVRSNIVSPDNPWPDAFAPDREYAFVPEPGEEFAFTRLSADTVMLRVPTFHRDYLEPFEALLAEHHDAITSTPNLLIDLRGNTGGSDATYEKLMGYLYTRPIYGISPEVRITPRNIAYLQELASGGELDEETQAWVEDILARAAVSDDGWVAMMAEGVLIETYPQVYDFPRRVGILTEGAGSSGDQFVIDARFSRKVTLLGAPTAGVIDYSNMVSADAPSGDFAIYWPMTRSMRLPEEPFDNVGVPVDVPYPEDVADQVAWAQDWLERQVD